MGKNPAEVVALAEARRAVRGESGAVRAGAVAAVAALLAVLGVIGWIGWRTFGAQPQRSIATMGHAYTTHDWERLEPYIDLDAIVDAGVEQLIPEELREGGGVLGELARGLAEEQKPALVERGRQRLREAVETQPANEGWFRMQRGVLAPLTSEIVSRSEQEARVRIDTRSRWGEIEVLMVPRGDRWVVVEVLNLPELLARAGTGQPGESSLRTLSPSSLSASSATSSPSEPQEKLDTDS